ncbi:Molybdopterin molybdenumtransferase (modular protein) [Desulfovibrionales bacterium]
MAGLDRDRLVEAGDYAGHAAVSQVLAEPAYARFSSPNFHCKAMDGIAAVAERTFGAKENHPLALRRVKDFLSINTGTLFLSISMRSL